MAFALPFGSRAHIMVAGVLSLSWIASYSARSYFDTNTPVFLYVILDAFLPFLFYKIAIAHRAAFAAIVSILHGMMALLHVSFLVIGPSVWLTYVWILNTLYALCNVTIAGGVVFYAGGGFRSIDAFIARRFPRWSIGGLRKQVN